MFCRPLSLPLLPILPIPPSLSLLNLPLSLSLSLCLSLSVSLTLSVSLSPSCPHPSTVEQTRHVCCSPAEIGQTNKRDTEGAGIWGDSLGAISHIKRSQGAFRGDPPVSLVAPVSLIVGFPGEMNRTQQTTLPATNMAPVGRCLEDQFPFEMTSCQHATGLSSDPLKA